MRVLCLHFCSFEGAVIILGGGGIGGVCVSVFTRQVFRTPALCWVLEVQAWAPVAAAA